MSIYTAASGGALLYRSPTVSIVAGSSGMSECSGIGVSRTYAETVWTHDDSGDTPARIWAFNTANGTLRKTFNMVNPSGGAAWTNSDFEELSLLQRPGGDQIFVYDTIGSPTTAGRLYRMTEPNPTTGAATQNVNANQITISFPSTVYSEANFVDPADGHFVAFYTSSNHDITVWRSTTSVVTAANLSTVSMEEIANLGQFTPHPIGLISGHTCEWLGSADIAPDRSCILLHPTSGNGPHYDRILIYNIADPVSTSIATALATTPVLGSDDGTDSDVVTEPQGEATAFLPASDGYMRIGEGSNRPIHIVDDNTPDPPAPPPITSQTPDGRTFSWNGPQLWSTATHQYGVWVRRDHGLMIGRHTHDSRTWTTHQFTGANATTLGLPHFQDDHVFPCVAVDAANRIWVISNMYRSMPMRALCTTNTDGNVAGPWQPTSFPNPTPLTGYTYPNFCGFSDGTLICHATNNGPTGLNSNHIYWRKAPTSQTWTYMGMVTRGNNFSPPWNGGPIPDDNSLGAYFHPFFVEPPGWPHPDRLHVHWLWRISDFPVSPSPPEESAHPSYIYSDDKGTTWKSADGTAITLPCQVNTQTAAQMNPTEYFWPGAGPTGSHIINGGSTMIDKLNGNVYIMQSSNPPTTAYNTLFTWDGSAWSAENFIPVPIGNVGRGPMVWLRDELWWLGRHPIDRAPLQLICYTSNRMFGLGGSIPYGNPNPDWLNEGFNFPGFAEPGYDPVLHGDGVISILVPEGDTPKVFTAGNNALTRI